MTDDGDQFAASFDFEAEDGEAAIGIVKDHPLDAAYQGFSGVPGHGHVDIIHASSKRLSGKKDLSNPGRCTLKMAFSSSPANPLSTSG